MKLVGAGIAAGLILAFGLTGMIARLPFGVDAFDPLTFAGVAVGMALLAAATICFRPLPIENGWATLNWNVSSRDSGAGSCKVRHSTLDSAAAADRQSAGICPYSNPF
jgi:hypothetical protein